MTAEIDSQPRCWERAVEVAGASATAGALPAHGARVAVVGCGTSYFMAQACAALREAAGAGESDAFAASLFPVTRRYDHVVAITRSGTTSEIVRLLRRLPAGARTTVISTGVGLPASRLARAAIVLDFADERSVVQTRFATSVLALWRAWLGDDCIAAIADARAVLVDDLDPAIVDRDRYAFLGDGWTVGPANEAALKLREASQSWAESYPAMEYRHGPISVADERTAVWMLGTPPAGLARDVAATGAAFVTSRVDPMAQLVRAQRLALARAERAGLDPDAPRNLNRAVVLPEG